MPELSKYQPDLPVPVAQGSSLNSLILGLLTTIVLPEVGIPATMVSFLGNLTTPDRINLYLAIAYNLTGTLKNTLELVKLAKEIGWIGTDSQADIKRIADALYIKEGSEDISLAQLVKRISTYKPTEGDHANQPIDLAQILYNQYTTLYVDIPNVGKIPLTDALARGLFTGFFRYYEQIPINGENGG